MSSAVPFLGISGFLLFTVGLLLGFVIPAMRNPRMGLSAHLTAAQTGPALIATSLFWSYLSVPAQWTDVLVWALIGSSYALVFGIALAAAFGAGKALPIAGGKHRASNLREGLVSVLVKGSSVVMMIAALAISIFAISGFAELPET